VKDTLLSFAVTHDEQKALQPIHAQQRFLTGLWNTIQNKALFLDSARNQNLSPQFACPGSDIDETCGGRSSNLLTVEMLDRISWDKIDEDNLNVLGGLIDEYNNSALYSSTRDWGDVAPILSPHRRKSLRQQVKDAAWLESYGLLKIYHRDYGHCDVPPEHSVELAAFVKAQRIDYRLYCQEGKRTITKGKIDLLNEISFNFKLSSDPKRGSPNKTLKSQKDSLICRPDEFKEHFIFLSKVITTRYGEVCWARHKWGGYWPGMICDPMQISAKSVRSHAANFYKAKQDTGMHQLVYFFETASEDDVELNKQFSMISSGAETLISWQSGVDTGFDKIVWEVDEQRQKFMSALQTANAASDLPVSDRMEVLGDILQEIISKSILHDTDEDSDESIVKNYISKHKHRKLNENKEKTYRTSVPHSDEEDLIILTLQAKYGNKWRKIASYLPGRTDNAVKNRYKILERLGRTVSDYKKNDVLHKSSTRLVVPLVAASNSKSKANTISTENAKTNVKSNKAAQSSRRASRTNRSVAKPLQKVSKSSRSQKPKYKKESLKGRKKVAQSSSRDNAYSPEEDNLILIMQRAHGNKWRLISSHMPGRSENGVKNRYNVLRNKLRRNEIVFPPNPLIFDPKNGTLSR